MNVAISNKGRVWGTLMVLAAICLPGIAVPKAAGQLVETIDISADEKKRVKFWLDHAWEKNQSNRNQSVELYELSPVKSPSVMIAYAVNRFRHNRVREAGDAVKAALDLAPDNIDARMLSVWVKAVRDQYDLAATEIHTLAKTIRTLNLPPRKLENTYRRIGRLMGYLQGPVGEQVNQEILHAAISELSVGLAPRHQELMRQERERLLADFKGRVQHLEQKANQSIKEKEVAQNTDRKLIQQENNRLQSQTQKIQDQQTAVRDQGQVKLEQALSRLRSLQSELAALDGEIRLVRNSIGALQAALFFRQSDSDASLFQSDVLRFQIQDRYFQLRSLNSRADAIAFDIDRAADEVTLIQNQYGGQLSQLERNLIDSGKRQRQNTKKLAKLAKPAKPNNKKIALLSNRITALNSYDQLPLELYRAELLTFVNQLKPMK